MRTTNKEFKVQIQEHIINILSEDYGTTVKEQMQAVVDGFKDWYGKYEQKRTPNRKDAYISWWMGLPSQFNIEFENYTIHQTMKNWWENAGETYKEQSSDKEASLYYALVYREFRNLCKKYEVNYL